ncbi:MAG: hypothetical protein Q4G60_08210 [bacterium]|nr:hypothetical protein [bacterium]
MKDIIIIYDDSQKPNQDIRCITGEKTFGDTIFKRVTLKERMGKELTQLPGVRKFVTVRGTDEIEAALSGLDASFGRCVIVHLFSNFGICDRDALRILFEKAGYINENYIVECGSRPAMVMLQNISEYQELLDRIPDTETNESMRVALEASGYTKMTTEAFVDLSDIHYFRQFITGGFEARFFNMLAGDAYTVTKQSVNQEKLKKEYDYYQFLPDDMKMWYVKPFHYEENETSASYMMERYHMTDIAIRYVHGAIGTEEFRDIMDKLFYYLKHRAEKEVSRTAYEENAEQLYVKKVEERVADLKQCPAFERLDRLVQIGTEFDGIDAVITWYMQIYRKITEKKTFRDVLVVGHGDLCFSNILYNQDASLLKLIDPRGASCEEDLYMNPFYDLAKLSHSVCGCYDYFNSDLFEISLEDDMHFKLSVMGDAYKEQYCKIFREYLQQNQIDYALIRLYEASLFLSMLPLHIDREKKVFGFILNAIQILKEIEN